ncbi:Cas8a1 family CRISPR/Cas system-associated protein [Anaerocellum danielii]|uniref:Cas8a1 family CRISPR/Cas system-associated protein n=1 Tax=Anaerocellum danielii TaxID=1387557 RepID=UPI0012FEFC76|nr:Cas8a1 family CRISPR/Cas system-associated protein [Caldicellulosiruptor danielii]
MTILEEMGYDINNFLKDDGRVVLGISYREDEIFKVWDQLTKNKFGYSYSGKKGGTQQYYYANQTEDSIKKRIEKFINHSTSTKGVERVCFFCYTKEMVKKQDIDPWTQAYGNILAGSDKTFGNLYWNNSAKDFICSKCQFIIMCHHIALIELKNFSEKSNQKSNSYLFINAPSFKLMWYLNKYVREIYEKKGKSSPRQIIGMSLIEMALKLNIQLGKWTAMNIEVVSKYTEKKDRKPMDKIDFFSLPYELVFLLSDRKIAALLSEIGEQSILNMVLNSDYTKILKLAEKIFKIALKSKNERSDKENEFINETIKNEKNKENLISFSEKLFKLYALIEEKVKKEVF